jgi:aromatase
MTIHMDFSVVVRAPMDEVWRLTNDVTLWPRLYDNHYKRAELVSRTTDRFVFRLVDEHDPAKSAISERILDPERRVVSGQRLTNEHGRYAFWRVRWEYKEHPSGVLLRWIQEFDFKPTFPVFDQIRQLVGRVRAPWIARTGLQHLARSVEAMVAAEAPVSAEG